MLCLHNACEFFRKFIWLYNLYLQISRNCIEVKHITIMIITIIYIFLSDVIFDHQLNPPPLKKSTPRFWHTPPLKIQKLQVPPFCQNWKFLAPPRFIMKKVKIFQCMVWHVQMKVVCCIILYHYLLMDAFCSIIRAGLYFFNSLV